jgi:hypothetical protein
MMCVCVCVYSAETPNASKPMEFFFNHSFAARHLVTDGAVKTNNRNGPDAMFSLAVDSSISESLSVRLSVCLYACYASFSVKGFLLNLAVRFHTKLY